MTYRDLIKSLAQKGQSNGESVSCKQVERILNILIDTLIEQTKNGVPVRLKNLGTVRPFKRKQRQRYIPGTDETKTFPPSLSVKLILSPELKRRLNT